MQLDIGSLTSLGGLLEVTKRLGDGDRQDGHYAVLQNIHKRRQAQERHDLQLPGRLTETVIASDGSGGRGDCVDVFLAVLLGNLVDAGNCGFLVCHVVRLANDGRQLGQEGQQCNA